MDIQPYPYPFKQLYILLRNTKQATNESLRKGTRGNNSAQINARNEVLQSLLLQFIKLKKKSFQRKLKNYFLYLKEDVVFLIKKKVAI